MEHIHANGQYFTKNELLQSKVLSFIHNEPTTILEPSIGRGDLVKYITSTRDVSFDMYEIDETIEMLPEINRSQIQYGDFLKQSIDKTYDTIVGNPPYVKTTSGNLYLKFIERCFRLLTDGGELIFIVPSDFTKITSANAIIDEMMSCGSFTDFYYPNNEKLFENASIDVVVFRYVKFKKTDEVSKCRVNDDLKYICNTLGILTVHDEQPDTKTLGDRFDVIVGIVSGKESVFKNSELGNMSVLNSKEKTDLYIKIDSFPTSNTALNEYMSRHKDTLKDRKIRNFTESNWFEWGALRNVKTVQKHFGKPCVYVSTLTRKKDVAFAGTIQYFGGGVLCLIPKNENEDLEEIVFKLNNETFKSNYTFAGRFKIGHKQLKNCRL